jgi:hypothetical protein
MLPACCPDSDFCPAAGELVCSRRGSSDVCCDQPDKHEPVDRAAWHQEEAAFERAWLDQWAQSQFYGRKTHRRAAAP